MKNNKEEDMGLVLARIDERLVHGIVVTQWVKNCEAQRIMVIDDAIALDEMRKQALRLSKPQGVAMSIISLDTAIENFKNQKYDGHNVLLVVNNVEVLEKLHNANIKIPKINIGILLDSDNRKKYDRSFAASDDEIKILKNLNAQGVTVTYQFAPSDKEKSINEY